MARPLLTDDLWQRIEPLLPPPTPRCFRFPGRKPLTHCQALTGIRFVLKTGINWNDLPRELNFASGSRCRRRRAEWQQAGVWVRLHALLLDELQGADQIDWSRASVDNSSARAQGGGEETGPSPTDRGKKGSKHHAVVDGHGIPLAAAVTAANAPDVTELLEVVDPVPDVRGKPGRPRRRPEALCGDRAYDSQPHREALRERDPAEAGAAEHRERQRAGGGALGGGAVLQPSAPVPLAAAADGLGVAGARCVPQAGVLAGLPQYLVKP